MKATKFVRIAAALLLGAASFSAGAQLRRANGTEFVGLITPLGLQ